MSTPSATLRDRTSDGVRGFSTARAKVEQLLSTAEAGDLLTDSIRLGSDAWDGNLALAEEAARRYDTVAANLSRNFNRIKDQTIDAGGPVADFFDAFVEGTADLVEIGTADLQDIPSVIGGLDDEEDRLKQARERANLQKRHNSEIQGLLNRLPPVTDEANAFADAQANVAGQTRTATEVLAGYREELRASTNPVLAMFDALEAVDEAQRAYDETLEDTEATQADVDAAAVDLAKAIDGAQQAAIDGDLSFDATLARWVEQGIITKGEAEDPRDVVKDLRDESDAYDGSDFVADFKAGGIRKAESEVQGLLNRADRWRGTHSATFIANNIVRGSVGNPAEQVLHGGAPSEYVHDVSTARCGRRGRRRHPGPVRRLPRRLVPVRAADGRPRLRLRDRTRPAQLDGLYIMPSPAGYRLGPIEAARFAHSFTDAQRHAEWTQLPPWPDPESVHDCVLWRSRADAPARCCRRSPGSRCSSAGTCTCTPSPGTA